MTSHVLRIALLLTFVACSRPVDTASVESPATPVQTAATPAAPRAPVSTDRSSYVLTTGPRGPEATIVTTLHAPADQPLYILNCNGATAPTLQRKVGETWKYSWMVGMNACLSAPIVVPAGGEHTARIRVHQDAGAVVEELESGTYRVVWTGVLTSVDENQRGPELPLEQRVSAPFTIEVP